MLNLMTTSQMSHTKLNMDQFACKMVGQQSSISQMILNFLTPFYHSMQQSNLTIDVVEGNLIPCWVCTDWDTYK